MSSAQKRAVQNHRARMEAQGLARFEVLGREGDKALIRSLARQLAQDGSEADSLRDQVNRAISGKPPTRGGVLAALRQSPLVGADLGLDRPRVEPREIDL